jgi:hypothetical protein
MNADENKEPCFCLIGVYPRSSAALILWGGYGKAQLGGRTPGQTTKQTQFGLCFQQIRIEKPRLAVSLRRLIRFCVL